MIIGLTWAGVCTPELPEVSQPLAPLLHLLVAVVVLPGLLGKVYLFIYYLFIIFIFYYLGEVGEHGGQGPPTHIIRPSLTPLVAADSWELANCLHRIVFHLGTFSKYS